MIDFYAEAVNTRTTPTLGRLLRGLDSIAVDSMDVVLRPLGIEAPSVLTYLDKGLGASILRAGVRLWDSGALSPAAAIKITRHNLLRPTSLIHETFHQVAHLTARRRRVAAMGARGGRGRGSVRPAWLRARPCPRQRRRRHNPAGIHHAASRPTPVCLAARDVQRGAMCQLAR